jgi:hypothetical protein
LAITWFLPLNEVFTQSLLQQSVRRKSLKRVAALVLVIILISGLGIVLAATTGSGGSADDPLISLNYLNSTVIEKLKASAKALQKQKLEPKHTAARERLDKIYIPDTEFSYAPEFTALDFDTGGRITLNEFGCFILFGGKGRLYITAGEVVNISTGEVCKNGELLKLNNKYFAVEESSAYIRLYTDDSWGMVDGYYNYVAAEEIPLRESFLDVGDEHWAAEYIFSLAEQKIVNGVGGYMFNPSGTVTRGTFVTVLGRIADIETSWYTVSGFDDTDITKWYGPYVAWAAEAGIVRGDGGNFKPEAPLSREQMAVIIANFASYMKAEAQEASDENPYSDSDKISSWAADAVLKVKALGLMTGKTNNAFDPQGTATRAEICAVAVRIMKLLNI